MSNKNKQPEIFKWGEDLINDKKKFTNKYFRKNLLEEKK